MKINFKKIDEYQKRVKEWLIFINDREGSQFKLEQNTTVKFIVPLINMLGWKHLSNDVEFEHYLRDSKDTKHKTRHVDIALYLHNANTKIPKILIEVKPIPKTGQSDMDGPVHQLFRDYLRNSKVTYGVVTNGLELIVFDRRFVRHDSKKARPLFRLKIEDFIEFSDVLWVLSKSRVEDGTFDKLATMFHSNEYWKKWFYPNREKIINKKFDELAKVYKTEEYWKNRKYGKVNIEYILPLIYAKEKLLKK